ncbi:MAG: invasin domain 3-containing protein [Halobacteriota archaeon]|nr:invasin domain 3-containing protein [Halobacteriota archaeon]
MKKLALPVMAMILFSCIAYPVIAADEYFYASGENIILGTGVSGDYTDTYSDDGSYRVVDEGLFVGGTETIFEDDFATDKGWANGGSQNEWQRGVPQGKGGSSHGNPDPNNDHTSGTGKVFGTDLTGDGDYEEDTNCWLESPTIDCSNYRDVNLEYYRWLNAEGDNNDHSYVEVYNVDTGGSDTVWSNGVYTYTDNSWNFQSINISDYADGNNIKIRFRLTSDGGWFDHWESSGWNIDDLKIEGTFVDYRLNATYPVGGITTGMENYTLNIAGRTSAENFTVTADGLFIGNITYNETIDTKFEDDFEDGDIGGWTTGGDANWFATSGESNTGSWSARAGSIGANDYTYIKRDITGPGDLTFYWKVSSESGGDYLYFRFDGSNVYSISGNVDWQQRTYSIPSGTHSIEWRYDKDILSVSGSDTGWIDDIKIEGAAPTDFIMTKNITSVAEDGSVTIRFVDTESNDITIDTLSIDEIEIHGAGELYRGVSLSDPSDQSTLQGVNATYQINVTNLANTQDDFTLVVTNTDNADVAELSSVLVSLDALESTNVSLNVTDNTPGTYNVSVTATSVTNSSANDMVTIMTTVLPDVTSPVINSVTLNETEVHIGDPILVTVNTTDDVGILNVTANGVLLTYQSGDIWEGTIISVAGINIPVDIIVYDNVGNSATDSSQSYNATDLIFPAAITDLFASTGINTSEVTLTWTAPGDDGNTGTALGYIVRYSTSQITNQGEFDSATDYPNIWTPQIAGSNENYTLTGLTPNTTYYFAIEAFDEVPNQASLSNSPMAVVPAPPVINSVTLNATEVHIGDPILVTVNATDDREVVNVTANGVSLTHQSGDIWNGTIISVEGINVTVNVIIYDEFGNNDTDSSQSYNASDMVPPAAIIDLFASTGMNPGEVNLTWTAPGDDGSTGTALGYIVRYSTSQITNQGEFDSATDYPNSWTPLIASSNESYTLSGLTPNTTYYFAIEAFDEVPNQADLSNCPSAVSQMNLTQLAAYIYLVAWPDSVEACGSPSDIVAIVLNDSYYGISGASVTFTTNMGYFNETISDNATVITNATGYANVTLMGDGTVGDATVEAKTYRGLMEITNTTIVEFIVGSTGGISLEADPTSLTVNNTSLITANVSDACGNVIAGATVNFTVTAGNGSLSNYSAVTNGSGIATTTLRVDTKAGINTVEAEVGMFTENVSVTGVAGDPEHLWLDPYPPILRADGNSTGIVIATVFDEFYNPVSGESVTLRIKGTNYTSPTNSSGQVYVGITSSTKIQTVYVFGTADTLSNVTTISFVGGDPAYITVKAQPSYIAVQGQLGVTNKSVIMATVTDDWYRPLENCTVSFTTTNGTLDSNTGVTDESGETSVILTSSYTPETVTVTALINSSLFDSTTVKFTDQPFLNVNTTLNPNNITELPAYINVTHILTGEGVVITKPLDVMHVIDRSGSMGWYGDVIHNSSGTLNNYMNYEMIDQFDINSSITTFDVLLVRQKEGETYELLRIISPTGKLCDKDTEPSGMDYVHSNSADRITVGSSGVETGTWQVWAKVDSSSHAPRDYRLSVQIPPERIDAAKNSAKSFVGLMDIDDQLGVVSFSSSGTLEEQLTLLDTQVNKDSVNSSINGIVASGGTAIGAGIDKAKLELMSSRSREDTIKIMILLSDGVDTEGSDPITSAQEAAQENITIYTIGFGESDHDLLNDIANITGGTYYYAVDVTELERIYGEIHEEIKKISASIQANVIVPGTEINGTFEGNAEYVPGSSKITYTPSGETAEDITAEPTLTNLSDRQIITFEINEMINIGDEVNITYKLYVNGSGEIIGFSNVTGADGSELGTFGPETVTNTGGGGGYIDTPPIPDAGPDQILILNLGLTVSFNGSNSTDDYGITKYKWVFGDGKESDWLGSATTSHDYPNLLGCYEVKLKVKDSFPQISQIYDSMNVTAIANPSDVVLSSNRSNIVMENMPGINAALITANVTYNNTGVRDGLNVTFTTTLGVFEETGTAIAMNTTINGNATITLLSESIAGPAVITATEEYTGSDSIALDIVSRGRITLE